MRGQIRLPEREGSDLAEKIIQINRVSKKSKGGSRVSFSALMIVGDRKGRVGMGLGKAKDVSSAVKKAGIYATNHMVSINMKGTTIPHEVRVKFGAAEVLLKPAPAGTGLIAGNVVRAIVDAAGIKDIVSKVLGSDNKAGNTYATFKALAQLKQI